MTTEYTYRLEHKFGFRILANKVQYLFDQLINSLLFGGYPLWEVVRFLCLKLPVCVLLGTTSLFSNSRPCPLCSTESDSHSTLLFPHPRSLCSRILQYFVPIRNPFQPNLQLKASASNSNTTFHFDRTTSITGSIFLGPLGLKHPPTTQWTTSTHLPLPFHHRPAGPKAGSAPSV